MRDRKTRMMNRRVQTMFGGGWWWWHWWVWICERRLSGVAESLKTKRKEESGGLIHTAHSMQ